MALVVWKTQDPNGNPIAALYSATSPTQGPWQAQGTPDGNCITDLGAAHYTVTITAWGFIPRILEADIADCGIITSALQYASFQPTRDEIINVRGNFLNLFDSEDIPIWDIYLATLFIQNKMDKFNDWITRLKNARTTHINLAISYNYDEQLGWINRYPFDGMDFTKDLDSFKAVVDKIRQLGFIPIIKLAFDGQGYDPVGWTYGWQWGMDNIKSLASSLAEYNENSLWSTGFDGCFPNWTPDQTRNILRKMRAELGDKAQIDTEFSGPGTYGYIHMGNGPADWVPDSLGILDNFSIMSMVIPPDATGTQQVASRILGPAAKNIDPPNVGPYYLHQMDGIKNINRCIYETCAFDTIRKKANSSTAVMIAQYIANYGFESFGNGQP